MAWALLAITGALALAVLALATLVLRLRHRLAAVEQQVHAPAPSVEADRGSVATVRPPSGSADPGDPGFLITHLGESDAGPPVDAGPVPVDAGPVPVDAVLFTDHLARESAVQLVALAHGWRRALSAPARNRIRFHMRHEVKRARRQRRVEMRLAHREWAARQRSAEAAGDSAA